MKNFLVVNLDVQQCFPGNQKKFPTSKKNINENFKYLNNIYFIYSPLNLNKLLHKIYLPLKTTN